MNIAPCWDIKGCSRSLISQFWKIFTNISATTLEYHNYPKYWDTITTKLILKFLPIYAKWTLLPLLFGPVHFQYKGSLFIFYFYHIFIEISVLNANSVDPDQRLHSENMACDLDLQLANVPFAGLRYKWVNEVPLPTY